MIPEFLMICWKVQFRQDCSVGADVVTLGTVPTPAVAYLVKNSDADAAIMLSASHNPYEFNGIKIFGWKDLS